MTTTVTLTVMTVGWTLLLDPKAPAQRRMIKTTAATVKRVETASRPIPTARLAQQTTSQSLPVGHKRLRHNHCPPGTTYYVPIIARLAQQTTSQSLPAWHNILRHNHCPAWHNILRHNHRPPGTTYYVTITARLAQHTTSQSLPA